MADEINFYMDIIKCVYFTFCETDLILHKIKNPHANAEILKRSHETGRKGKKGNHIGKNQRLIRFVRLNQSISRSGLTFAKLAAKRSPKTEK